MIIAIDGACRRNGKSTCLTAGAAFIVGPEFNTLKLIHEKGSTSQRGEMLALLTGLSYGYDISNEHVYLITDSEYIYNTISKGWINNWERKGWITSSGEPVKNQDLWKKISPILNQYRN